MILRLELSKLDPGIPKDLKSIKIHWKISEEQIVKSYFSFILLSKKKKKKNH